MKEKKENDLNSLRLQIDGIDAKILDLINHRLEIGKQVGNIKKETGAKILDKSRESKVIKNLLEMNRGPATKELLQYIFNVIITATREIQRPRTVSFLGPQASYTHIAALRHFNHFGDFLEQPNLYEVFRQVDRNESHFGVVPIENSTEGAVNHTLDLFTEFNLNICAEHYERISHDLISLTGDAADVKTIISHPQPIAQCRTWIRNRFGNVKMIETSSSSKAAMMASEDKSIAAIASRQAAHLYGLLTIESKIEDQSGNITRFLVIGKDRPAPTGNDRTSIMFATPHLPGSLFKALEPIDRAGLNMLKLESRPKRHQNWSYYFFVDIAGHHTEDTVSQTIEEVRAHALSLKILGSYPVAEKREANHD
ncbi:MAG: prephenate dehydratase [Desulfobacterales bacterium]|nr:prephenate dehydratase [Desulfobacterales bacterium]